MLWYKSPLSLLLLFLHSFSLLTSSLQNASVSILHNLQQYKYYSHPLAFFILSTFFLQFSPITFPFAPSLSFSLSQGYVFFFFPDWWGDRHPRVAPQQHTARSSGLTTSSTSEAWTARRSSSPRTFLPCPSKRDGAPPCIFQPSKAANMLRLQACPFFIARERMRQIETRSHPRKLPHLPKFLLRAQWFINQDSAFLSSHSPFLGYSWMSEFYRFASYLQLQCM